MKNKVIAILVCFGIISLTGNLSAEVNFDQVVDIKSELKAVSEDLNVPVPQPNKYPVHSYYTTDCARFSFGPSDNEITSEKVWLFSTEYVQECYMVPVHGPNGQVHYVERCYERPGMTYRQAGQINIKPRKLFPWERESFEICLRGPWMNLYIDEAAYKYTVRKVGNYDTLFELSPQHKIAMKPDINGLNPLEFSYDNETKKYKFVIKDEWAKEYEGEKVAIKVELYRSIPNWFDSYKGEKEWTFDIAPSYEMSFTEKDLEQPRNDNNDPVMRGPKKFYLKWGFKRIGNISKDTFMKKGKTNEIEVSK
jgi:hypothetical protein